MLGRRTSVPVIAVVAAALLAPAAPSAAAATRTPSTVLGHVPGVYQNPLDLRLRNGARAESCADPNVIHGQTAGDTSWYLYCTSDPLTSTEHDATGALVIHLLPTYRSKDLVHWTYAGDAFAQRPSWVAPTAGLWAPKVTYTQGQYLLYYTASDTSLPGGGSAIGVATGPTPTGPWTDKGTPVVEPQDAPCCPGSRRWVFDPEVITANGTSYVYFGSYFGGIDVRTLSPDGLTSDPATQKQIAIDNRYEGTNIVKHGGWYYFLGSATNCCAGPLTGYSVFAARSRSPLGPFVDKDGVPITAGRVGGTPVLSMNGNRWVGPGHTDVLTDFSGQMWMVFHAVDQNDPYFAGNVGFTKRPALIDPLDWVNGWPVVNGGWFASSWPHPAPAAQPGTVTAYRPILRPYDVPGWRVPARSDNFSGTALRSQWTWVRPPDPSTYSVSGGALHWQTQNTDLYVDTNNASVLTEPAPKGNYIVETKVHLNVPAGGCCQNFVQAGLVIYGDDDNFLKLADVSIFDTRQSEWAKELSPVPAGYPRYGNTVVGPVGDETYLRIVKRSLWGKDYYTAYTSLDGHSWDRGGTWTHKPGSNARIGLVSMGGTGFTADFDYVHVSRVRLSLHSR